MEKRKEIACQLYPSSFSFFLNKKTIAFLKAPTPPRRFPFTSHLPDYVWLQGILGS